MFTIQTAQRYFWLFGVAMLVACQPSGTVDVTPTMLTRTLPLPTLPLSTSQPTQTPPSTSLPRFPLDGYVIAFIENGTIYFQDGDDLPLKLTDVGETTLRPIISDDNKKIIFTHNNGSVYSINADGTQETVVIPKDWLTSLNMGAGDRFLNYEFIPSSHELLLKTYVCTSREFRSLCSTSLYIAYSDTGRIEKLVDLGLAYQQNFNDGNIVISPNGEMIAVGTLDGVDIFTLGGEMVRENILPYQSINPRLPFIYWLPDSSGLTIALPDKEYESRAYDNLPAYSIWSYSIESDSAIQSPIDPSHIAEFFDVSLDGKWIVYGGVGDADPDLYLGNLVTGEVRFFDQSPQPPFVWSPDNKHFVYGIGLYHMASVDDLSPRDNHCGLLWWIDVNHFICAKFYSPSIRYLVAKVDGDIVEIYDLGLPQNARSLFFIKSK